MKTTARNEFNGTITEVKSGGVMSEVVVHVADNLDISATITNDSKESLGLEVGKEVMMLIKSSLVILSKEKLQATARNNILTKVAEVIKGAVNSEVKLFVGNKLLCSVVTNDAVEDLDIQVGENIYAIFKASSVIVVA
jgi:molybdate transport system regulatory protein